MGARSGAAVDGVWLCLGTLTAVRVPAPSAVTPRVAAWAMCLAVVPGVALGAIVAGVAWGAAWCGVPELAVGFLGVGVLAGLTRALHADGLADTVDGLGASFDVGRALAVMRTGDVGPMGAVALVVTLGTQAACIGALAETPVVVAACVAASRVALVWSACRVFRPARPDGLGRGVIASVPVGVAAAVVSGALVAAGAVGAVWADPWVAAGSVAAAIATTHLVAWHCTRRLGGLTGDVLGAAVELSLAAALLESVALTT